MSTRSRWTLSVVVLCLVAAAAAVFFTGRSSRGATEPAAGSSPSSATASATFSSSPKSSTSTTAPPAPSASSSMVAPAPSAPVETTAPAVAPQQNKVDVVVTSSGRNASTGSVEARGFADVVESGAQCTLRLTRAAVVVEQATAAEPDATTTSCGTVAVPANKLTTGTWTGVLVYSSTTARGESSPFTIEVP